MNKHKVISTKVRSTKYFDKAGRERAWIEALNSEWLIWTNLVRVGVEQTVGQVKNILYQGRSEGSNKIRAEDTAVSSECGSTSNPMGVSLHPLSILAGKLQSRNASVPRPRPPCPPVPPTPPHPPVR